jgi:hypothetical protein
VGCVVCVKVPHYDPVTDTIRDCEEGTFTYYHELRHREQYVSGLADKFDIMHIYLYYAAIIAGGVGLVFFDAFTMVFLIGVCMFPHVLACLYLEIDANIVGYYNYRKHEKKA